MAIMTRNNKNIERKEKVALTPEFEAKASASLGRMLAHNMLLADYAEKHGYEITLDVLAGTTGEFAHAVVVSVDPEGNDVIVYDRQFLDNENGIMNYSGRKNSNGYISYDFGTVAKDLFYSMLYNDAVANGEIDETVGMKKVRKLNKLNRIIPVEADVTEMPATGTDACF